MSFSIKWRNHEIYHMTDCLEWLLRVPSSTNNGCPGVYVCLNKSVLSYVACNIVLTEKCDLHIAVLLKNCKFPGSKANFVIKIFFSFSSIKLGMMVLKISDQFRNSVQMNSTTKVYHGSQNNVHILLAQKR